MFGFLIGTACLIGLIKVLRHGRGWGGGCGYGGGCGGYGGYGGGGYYRGHGGWGGHHGHRERGWGERGWGERGWGGPSFFVRAIFERLDTTPAQEKVIVAAIDELRATAFKSRDEIGRTRADLAKAMRAGSFDEVLLGELFARHDSEIETMRKAGVGALAKIHEVLDERQRARLADLIEAGPGFFRHWSRGYAV